MGVERRGRFVDGVAMIVAFDHDVRGESRNPMGDSSYIFLPRRQRREAGANVALRSGARDVCERMIYSSIR